MYFAFKKSPMNQEYLRTLLPHTRHTLYMNHAGMAPVSTPVMEAINRYLDLRHGHDISNFGYALEKAAQLRERVGKLLGTSSAYVGLAQNTSEALNILTLGIDWKPGDRIAIPDCEFPANVYPFLHLQRRGVEIDFIPTHEGTFTLEDVEQVLTPRTRMLSVSWVQFLSGFKVDLKALGALCNDHKIWFVVDAIQGFGALQLSDTVEACHIDFLATGGQKWLMSVQGQGFFYISPDLFDHLTPPKAGWLHGPVDWEHLSDYKLTFHEDARRFELGTPNALGIVALEAALALYQQADPAWCESEVLLRARELREGLTEQGLQIYGTTDEAHASGIVSVYHPAPEALHAFLRRQNIRTATRNAKLRFSPTYYNTSEEVERVLEAVYDFSKVSKEV